MGWERGRAKGGGWCGREGEDLLYGHKEKERREGQASREETSGGREGRAGRLSLKVRQSIPTPPQPQARQHNEHTHTHTHTHKQTDTPSLPTTHCSYLSERLPGVGGVLPSSACMLGAALRVE